MKARDLPAMNSINLHHYWMPFTDNRRFKAKPRLVASAKDMYFTTVEGKQVLDGLATLWCVNAGHSRPRIVEAIRKQAGELDFGSHGLQRLKIGGVDDLHVDAYLVHVAHARRHVEQFARRDRGVGARVVPPVAQARLSVDEPEAVRALVP